ncbi:unnamed protein product [Xylocopa violacea]|uniref:Meckelin n=1 Tax=Xylocopa violacea TaxID=135666 RepID=A0ABP1PEK8_XYLVO
MVCFKGKSVVFYFLIYWTRIIQLVIASKEVLEFSEPSKCKSNEYFDTVSLSCMECGTIKNLIPSADRLRCICNKFSKKIGFDNGHPICIFCGVNARVTTDGNDCVPCNNRTCTCASNEVQIDRSLNGTVLEAMHCLSCPNNTYPFFYGSKCLPCETFEYSYYENDMYFTKYYYTRIQHYCLNKRISFGKQNSKEVFQTKFDGHNLDSYYFRNNLESAIYFCKKKDKQACEHLSNLCILSLYANDAACKLFMQTQKSSIWMFYDKHEIITVLNNEQITQKYSFRKGDNSSILNFTVATFSLDGNFKSIGAFNIPCNLLQHVRFGINLEKKCKLVVKDLIQTKMEFMYPYLTFMRNDNILMFALPILIKNINQNNKKVSDWQLVRKFLFVDNISGYRTISNHTVNTTQKVGKLCLLRYMKSLNVIINLQNIKDKNKIYPPLLVIEYADITYEEIDKTVDVTLDYKITFTIKDSNINSYLMIIIGIFSGLVLIFSGLKAWSYKKRHHVSFFNISVYVWFFIYAMSIAANIIILCLITLCLYLFIFYKGQTVSYILFPEGGSEKAIKTFTVVAFFFKLIEILGFICQHWNIDIFFIDWEQTKLVYNQSKYDSSCISINELYIDELSKNTDKHFQMSSESITAMRKRISYKLNKYNNLKCFNKFSAVRKDKTHASAVNSISEISTKIMDGYGFNVLPISIWRTYYIINQWLKLQTIRKTNIIVQLVGVLCIFQIIQLCPWILAISELTSKFSENGYDFILYYTVCILIYILIYCTQWLMFIVLCGQCTTNRMQEFISLCSTANISVFILPFNYYGFYIHGRSVHGFADTDLPTLINNIQMEKKNLCAHRGLVPGTTQQTFILYLTKTFRIILDDCLKLANTEKNNFIRSYCFPATNWEHSLNTQLKLKQFLCKFLDHCIKKEDYTIKEQHFFEKLFNIVFSYNEEKSVFCIDNNYTFSQALLYGNEWLLATFEISIFTFIIVLCEDCILAIVITISISMLLTIIVKHNCKKNLNNYILLDKIISYREH